VQGLTTNEKHKEIYQIKQQMEELKTAQQEDKKE
jgi:hypothetical protein